jgi:hypothetical protein
MEDNSEAITEKDTSKQETWKLYNSVIFWVKLARKQLDGIKQSLNSEETDLVINFAHNELKSAIRTNEHMRDKWHNPFLQLESEPSIMPDGETMRQRLSRLLPTVWADAEFWKIVNSGPDSLAKYIAVTDHLRMRYLLDVRFYPGVWRKLVNRPMQRAYLFGIMVFAAQHYFHVENADPEFKGAFLDDKFSDEELGRLVKHYAYFPYDDPRSNLASRLLPENALKGLRLAIGKFRSDLDWIIKNPGKIHARRAPTPRHKPASSTNVPHLEQMIELLRGEPGLSDYQLSLKHFGDAVDVHRKLAKQAKAVARFREGISVKQHRPRGSRLPFHEEN